MPFPLAAALVAGSSLLGQGANAYATGRTNKKTRQWNEKMYERQRQDALADFNMTNQYNSPSEVMARLRKAGLNPALAYGDSATTQAGAIRSSSVESWKPQAPQFDPGSAVQGGLAAHYDTQIKEAQTDNLRTQNTILLEQQKLIQAQVVKTLSEIPQTQATTERIKSETKKIMFDLGLSTDLRQNSMEVANQTLENMKTANLAQKTGIKATETSTRATEAQIKKTMADIQFTVDSNRRANQLQSLTMQKAAEEILTQQMNRGVSIQQREKIMQEIKNLKKDERLKQLDIDLKKVGVQPTDELWQRALARILSELM